MKNDGKIEKDNSLKSRWDKKKNNQPKPKSKNFEEYLENNMEEIYKNKENQNLYEVKYKIIQIRMVLFFEL